MAWMKEDKTEKAPNILLITKRFNEVSDHLATCISIFVQCPLREISFMW